MPSTPNATAENGNRSNKQVNPTPLIRSQPTPSLSHLRRSPPSLGHCYSDSPTSQLSWSHPSQVLTFDSRLPVHNTCLALRHVDLVCPCSDKLFKEIRNQNFEVVVQVLRQRATSMKQDYTEMQSTVRPHIHKCAWNALTLIPD
nr:vacuolar protein-sorting-associated protein 33 homolog [Ipomoea trifida]GLL17168.1 vacuolar protein-sorting-associated protein 33 homolog [Ipomoea trifida]